MQYIAPLIQTLLWVTLIAVIVWRFNKPIHALLTALSQRIEAGSGVKAGPFELSELKPQDPGRQRQKVEAELLELEALEDGSSKSPAPIQRSTTQALYFAAEDLALRAVQDEYGVPVSRQVTVGSDVGYDGAFVVNGRLHIVEVKYYRGWAQAAKLKASLEHIAHSVEGYRWKDVQIVLAVVFERAEDIEPNQPRIEEVIAAIRARIALRCYSMPELRAKFGVSGN